MLFKHFYDKNITFQTFLKGSESTFLMLVYGLVYIFQIEILKGLDVQSDWKWFASFLGGKINDIQVIFGLKMSWKGKFGHAPELTLL